MISVALSAASPGFWMVFPKNATASYGPKYQQLGGIIHALLPSVVELLYHWKREAVPSAVLAGGLSREQLKSTVKPR